MSAVSFSDFQKVQRPYYKEEHLMFQEAIRKFLEKEADIYRFNGKIPVIWYIMLRPGRISKIVGLDKIKENRYYVDYEARMHEGDIVPDTEDVRRLLGAVLFLFDDTNALDDFLNTQLPFVSVLDSDGNELVIEDLEKIKSVLQHREDELSERL